MSCLDHRCHLLHDVTPGTAPSAYRREVIFSAFVTFVLSVLQSQVHALLGLHAVQSIAWMQ
jgi:hypothetical protein